MKYYAVLTLILCIIMMFSPLIAMVIYNEALFKKTVNDQTVSVAETENSNSTIKVFQTMSSKVIETDIYDYVIGVVAAEMPTTYHTEALKAQAVAAYSYALWVKQNADNPEKAFYDITDSPSSHQTFFDNEQLKDMWGDKYEKNIKTLKDAVNSVLGEYLSWKGEPAMCVYHAISSGKTQSAKQAWGNDITYLKSVIAPGDTLSPNYDCESIKTVKNISSALEIKADDNLKITTDTAEGGYVKTVNVNSKKLTGTEFAKALNLSSPCFTISDESGNFVFSVKGKGHGVGMSQYSADYMARQGCGYEEILAHFYPGTTLLAND